VFPGGDGECSCGKPDCGAAGKHPLARLAPRGFKDATTDLRTVFQWWRDHPESNIGCATGPASGFWVVDVDNVADGQALFDRFGCNVVTRAVQTGSNGLHLHFAVPADGEPVTNRTGVDGLAIDVRGDGGYCILPPSVNGSGPYVWHNEDVEPAEAPQSLLDLVRRREPKTPTCAPPSDVPVEERERRAVAYLSACPPAVTKQGGHDQTFAVVRSVVYGFDLGADRGFELLRDHYNARCQPPWSEKELRHKCGDADGKPYGKPRGHLLTGDDIPPDNPHHLADTFLDAQPTRLRHWRGEFWKYDGGAYRNVPEGDVTNDLVNHIRDVFDAHHRRELRAWERKSETKRSPTKPSLKGVTQPLTGNVMLALRATCGLPSSVEAPAWTDGLCGPDAANVIAVRNGLLDVTTGALVPSDPSFFTLSALPFDYDPDAPQPAKFFSFLRSLWPNDPQSIDTLQEYFGYALTSDTSQQKILLVVGPPRSGKGTLTRILRELVGPVNVAGPTLASLANNFGLQPLVGKSLAVISDARLSNRIDVSAVVERLLSISGEDVLTVDRKFLTSVTTKFSTRFVITTNELPRLPDASGAIISDFLTLRLTCSWRGREDPHLFDNLRAELPGILNWATEGLRRLRERGRFVQPDTGCELVHDLEALASPVATFINERCEIGSEFTVGTTTLYGHWRVWCEEHGHTAGTEEAFGADLRAVLPNLGRSRPREGGKRVCAYIGLRLQT
jgi:putative DNA primase/helicase